MAVSVDGNLIWQEGFGYADVENRVDCKPDTGEIVCLKLYWSLEGGELQIERKGKFFFKNPLSSCCSVAHRFHKQSNNGLSPGHDVGRWNR